MYTVYLDPHFDFDGRSGGAAVDYIAPNLGTQAETKSWLLHDIMYYDVGFTFSEANDFLLTNLRKNCGYGWFKAHTIWAAVQLFGKSSFGTPKIADREYPNIARIHVSKPESRK